MLRGCYDEKKMPMVLSVLAALKIRWAVHRHPPDIEAALEGMDWRPKLGAPRQHIHAYVYMYIYITYRLYMYIYIYILCGSVIMQVVEFPLSPFLGCPIWCLNPFPLASVHRIKTEAPRKGCHIRTLVRPIMQSLHPSYGSTIHKH